MCGSHPRSTPIRGGRERLILAFCVCFLCKVQGPRAREMGVLAGDGFSQFFLLIFGWGRTLADASQPKIFPNPNGDRPVPIGQREASTGNF